MQLTLKNLNKKPVRFNLYIILYLFYCYIFKIIVFIESVYAVAKTYGADLYKRINEAFSLQA